MKQYSKKLFSIAMLLGTAAVTVEAAPNVTPYLQFRSQGRNNARKVVNATIFQTDLYDQDSCYGSLDLTLEYDRSFRPQNITDALFGADAVKLSTATTNDTTKHGRSIVVSGSDLETRAATDWMAENFLLPNNFRSTMTFSPLVQSVLVNFDWFMGMDKWTPGLYFRLYGPVVNNRTSLNFEENVISAGSNTDGENYAPGFFTGTGVPVGQLFSKAEQFFSGEALTDIEGITIAPLQYAKFQTTGHKSKTGFAELRGEFGWNYLQEKYRVGFNLQAAAPTGTRPKAEFMLEPEIGNGRHWELGVGLKGAWSMWRSEDEERQFNFTVEADITHLFAAKQTRTFDLVGKPNSRYMLAQELISNVDDDPILTGDSNAGFQFNAAYSPVANISTRKIKSSFSVQGDVVAMFTYASRGFTWDLGYNFWGLSTEKISLSTSTDGSTSSVGKAFPANTWALKGNANVIGELPTPDQDLIGLAATQSGATIHAGTNTGDAAVTNNGIDTPVAATASLNGGTAVAVGIVDDSATAINTSATPVFITEASLDLDGAKMRGYSNKIFTNFGYTWNNNERWNPFLGLGASGEFGSHSSHDSTTATTTSTATTGSGKSNSFGLSQWAIWLKFGVSYH